MMLVKFFDDYTLDPDSEDLKQLVEKLRMN